MYMLCCCCALYAHVRGIGTADILSITYHQLFEILHRAIAIVIMGEGKLHVGTNNNENPSRG